MNYDGINLDREFRDIVKDNGWWMVLRSFNLAKHSQYWNEQSKEAIGGSPWEFNDIIFKGRRKESIFGDAETYETRQVLTDVYNTIFYIVSKVRPKKEDQLIEIPLDERLLPKAPRFVRAFEVFDIKHVESKIEHGLIYSRVYGRKYTARDDATLKGPLKVRYLKI